jgi:hypothetical protein
MKAVWEKAEILSKSPRHVARASLDADPPVRSDARRHI